MKAPCSRQQIAHGAQHFGNFSLKPRAAQDDEVAGMARPYNSRSLLQSLVERVQNAWMFSRAEAELHGLSDYQLADLGLSRSQIAPAVRGDLYR